MKRLIKWIGFALLACLVVAVIGALLGGGKKTSDTANTPSTSQGQATQQEQPASEKAVTPSTAQTAKPTNTPRPQPSPTPIPVVGTDVTVGKIKWKVTAASVLGQTLKSDNQFVTDKTTSGTFVRVSYQIENLGTDKVYFEAPKLVDNQKRKFSDYNEALLFIPDKEQCILKELNPNISTLCTVIYEVAADAKQLTAEATSLTLLGGSQVLIDLAISN